MQLVFEQIRSGGDRNFGYLLADRDAKQAMLIDPSYSPDQFFERCLDQGLTVSHIVNTHSHPDHVNGNERAVELSRAPIAAHPLMRPDIPLGDGAELCAGAIRLTVIHVPGHCEDHIVLFEPTYRLLITGDLLFVGKVGGTRTDEDARTEWSSLQKLLAAVPDDVTVWPGHDYGARPSSTIGLERATNPFLRCRDVNEFMALKRDWAEYKKRLGLR